jgi:4-amino-4-deoxy-L-arabinose transferase-like glycosyltransferase
MLLDALRSRYAANRSLINLSIIVFFAFAIRLAVRLHKGADDFVDVGYTTIFQTAREVAAGNYTNLAVRPPVYPALLALITGLGGGFFTIAVIQSAIGAGTVVFVFLIGRALFGQRSALIAAILTALYPYYFYHDTSLQETSLVALLSTASVYLLLRARTGGRIWLWLVTGLVLGVNVLTRTTMLPFSVCAVVWIAIVGEGLAAKKLLRAGVILLALCLPVGGWMARNDIVLGRPVLSTESGKQFWMAHNPYTFSRYPAQSIDRSEAVAFRAFTPLEKAQLQHLRNPLDRSDWLKQRGLAYVRAHPGATLVGAVRKVTTGFSLIFSPWGGWGTELAYLLSYGPILLLGLVGAWLTRRAWREHAIIYLQVFGFTGVTADYWAHTSHRVYLDVFLMLYAAFVIDRAAASGGSLANVLGGGSAAPGEDHPAGRAAEPG